MKRIGIYSGSFDPVHDGHVEFARQAITRAKLDKVYFMAERSPRWKQGVRALEHREAMLALATKAHKDLGQLIVDDDRFTVELTLPRLEARFAGAKLVFLMGDHVFMRLASWGNVKTLVARVDFVVGLRHKEPADIKQQIALLKKLTTITPRVTVVTTAHHLTSSSKIRAALRHGVAPYGVSAPVLRYIKQQGLYESAGISK
jgi:nicotinate-nucleotide adenylyltransferase